jgi:hypothetical protein
MMSYSVAQPVETVQGDHSYKDVGSAASIQGTGGQCWTFPGAGSKEEVKA